MDYIEREAAIRAVHGQRGPCRSPAQNQMLDYLKAAVIRIPAADVVPMVRAEWVNPHWRNNDYCYDCSNCGGEAMHRGYRWRDEKTYPICPNCGARMYGGADNETD